eukprot:12077993-Alexandrium_andersonii.AAC.1
MSPRATASRSAWPSGVACLSLRADVATGVASGAALAGAFGGAEAAAWPPRPDGETAAAGSAFAP